MNAAHYEEWFVKNFLPHIQSGSVIVLDNASYHSTKVEQILTSASRKTEIQAWLTEKNIAWHNDMLKTELFQFLSANRKSYERFRIDEIGADQGHIVLRLPPYHCELNPIELVWSQIKGHAASEYRTSMDEALKFTKEGMEIVTASAWADCVRHVIKEEEKMWELDGLAVNVIENIEFTVGGDTSDDSDTDDIDLSGTSLLKNSPFQG